MLRYTLTHNVWCLVTPSPYNLYCVGGEVKHCTIQSMFSHCTDRYVGLSAHATGICVWAEPVCVVCHVQRCRNVRRRGFYGRRQYSWSRDLSVNQRVSTHVRSVSMTHTYCWPCPSQFHYVCLRLSVSVSVCLCHWWC